MHRLAEALDHLGREARIIQDNASFHPDWFTSNVRTVSQSEFRLCIDLQSDRDVVIIPETFMPVLSRYAPGLPKIIFNQNGAYSFGLSKRDSLLAPDYVSGFMLILSSSMYSVFHGTTRFYSKMDSSSILIG